MKYTTDTLRSLFGALGDPTRDKAAGIYYDPTFLDDSQLLNMYRGSWLPRKIVNIPARDSVRAWRDYQGEQPTIQKIETEEKRLQYRQKIEEALVRARLFGGSGILIGTGETDLTKPLEVERISVGGVKYLTVMSRCRLFAQALDTDPQSEFFEKPKLYRINETDIHPSRLIIFKGAQHPEPFYNFGVTTGWGDSVLCALVDAIKQLDATAANIASLVFEANVDVFGVPDLLDHASDPIYQKNWTDRVSLAAINKSVNRALILDADETYERKQVAFTGLPDIVHVLMQLVSGGSDIPATRLLGMSPAGLSSTGESDLRNYYDGVNSEQNITLRPAMNRADEAIWRSAGAWNKDLTYEWASLWQITQKERAEIGKLIADTANVINTTGLVSPPALSNALVNTLVENGIYPGLEQEVADEPVDFAALLQHETAMRAKEAAPTPAPASAAFAKDAAPRPLYISRRVINAAEIIAWAKGQGFETALTTADMHVTICFSREPVDWFEVGEPWESKIEIAEGGPRLVEQFGSGAVVLLFACRELNYRNAAVIRAGGSNEYAEYQPHITISYNAQEMDLTKIAPYTGKIVLGPEIFKALVDNWSALVREK